MPSAPGIPVMTPQQQQTIQQALKNPHASDEFINNLMPITPEGMLMGAGAGVAVSKGFNALFDGGANSKIARSAQWLDNLPVVRQVSQFLEDRAFTWMRGKDNWTRQLATSMTPAEVERHLIKTHVDALKVLEGTGAVKADRLPAKVLANLKNLSDLKGAEKQLTEYIALAKPNVPLWRRLWSQPIPPVKTSLLKLAQEVPAGKLGEEFPLILDKYKGNLSPELMKLIREKAAESPKDLKKYLTSLGALSDSASPELSKALDRLRRRFRGLGNFYMHSYGDQHRLAQELAKKNIGPIGRAYAGALNYLRRTFGGETLSTGWNRGASNSGGVGGFFRKLFGPMMSGGLIFGLALGEAGKAESGDKVKSFFHNLLGTGVGLLLGIEVGRKILNGSGIVMRLMPVLGTRIFLSIPKLGKITWGGLVTELIAMFIISTPFQKAGEKISNMIFGKPKHIRTEELKRQGIYPAQVPPRPPEDPAAAGSPFERFRNQAHPAGTPPGKAPSSRPIEPLTISVSEIMKTPVRDEQEQIGQRLESMLADHKKFNIFDNPFPRAEEI